ncbi:hypothetical protein JOB18_007263 [Solea senegalensis]|uniref:Uncharacterized protein n=1 Tax=Solea senegalensis TaxID=28829 RepID=A0AAV6PDQ5_SOLSE|nr:hypothetical protein JOB18_007263 [Solea senegalensis]
MKDFSPEQQEWRVSMDPERCHIKEEQEELWINQREDDIIAVIVKGEEDDEKPGSSQTRHSRTGENRADCGRPESARNLGLRGHPGPGTEDKNEEEEEEDSSETDNSEDEWKTTKIN